MALMHGHCAGSVQTLDCGLWTGLDHGLDWTMDWTMDWTVDCAGLRTEPAGVRVHPNLVQSLFILFLLKSWTGSVLLKGISQCFLVSSITCRNKEAIEWVWSFLCGKIEHKTTPITSSSLSQAMTLGRKNLLANLNLA